MSFDSPTIVDELRHLLSGLYRRPGERRRGTRKHPSHAAPQASARASQFTTAFECPQTNREFRRLSGVGDEWTPEETWHEVVRVLDSPRVNTEEARAARYLLHIEPVWQSPEPDSERVWRQKIAARALDLSWDANKFRFRDDRTPAFDSDIVDRALNAVQAALRQATTSARARSSATDTRTGGGRSGVTSPWTPVIEAELIRRLERLPQHYPAHLSTSILAPMLNPHIQVPADFPDPDAVPTLPPLERDESIDVSELLRSAEGRALVVGDAGTGKSTLLRHLVLTQIDELAGAACFFVPLIDLAEALPEHTLPLPDLIETVIAVCTNLYGSVDSAARARLGKFMEFEDSTLLCLDGLDEVPGGTLADRASRAIEVLSAIPGALVVSTRPGPRVAVPDGFETIVMRPVRSAIDLFDVYFEDAEDPRKKRALELLELPSAGDIIGSPLLLGFVAYAASFDRQFDTLPDLYDQYIALTLERIWKAAGLHELDDVAIARLIDVARGLAWRMAYGTGEQPTARGWREAETLDQMLREAAADEQVDLARFVKAEGLFTTSIAASSRLHTHYRWVHRTVQEHLVAMHMQERIADDPSAVVAHLMELLSSRDDWRVVVTHFFARMRGPAQADFLRSVAELENDPRMITGEAEALLGSLMQFVDDDSPAASFMLERLRSAGRWDVWFFLDPRGAREALIEAAGADTPIGELLGVDHPLVREHFDVETLRGLIAAFMRNPRIHYGPLLELCWALESRIPMEGVHAFFEVIAAGTPGLPTKKWPADLLEKISLSAAAERVREHTDLSLRWRLTYFFVHGLGGDASQFIGEHGPLDQVAWDLVQIVDNEIKGNAYSLGDSLIKAVDGRFGDALAYVAAKSISAEAVRGIVKLPWAVVGAWEYLLLNGGSADETALIRDEPRAPNDVLLDYEPSWRGDPDLMCQLYRAIAESVLRPESVTSAALAELYRKVICDPDRAEFDYLHARVDVHTVMNVLNAALNLRGRDGIAEEILARDPETWRGSAGPLRILAAYVSSRYDARQTEWDDERYDRHWGDMAQLFYDVTTWGARAQIAAMALFPTHFMENPKLMESTLGALDESVLSIPGNVAWLDRTMLLFRPRFWRENRQRFLAPLLTKVSAQAASQRSSYRSPRAS